MAKKSKAEKAALKRAKAEAKAIAKEIKRLARLDRKKISSFAYGEDSHTEVNKKMSHKDFPLFLRKNFEEAGEKINQ